MEFRELPKKGAIASLWRVALPIAVLGVGVVALAICLARLTSGSVGSEKFVERGASGGVTFVFPPRDDGRRYSATELMAAAKTLGSRQDITAVRAVSTDAELNLLRLATRASAKRFVFGDCKANDDTIRELSKNSHVEVLEIAYCEAFSGRGLRAFASHRGLRRLEVELPASIVFSSLNGNMYLQSIKMEGRLKDEDFSGVSALTGIQEMYLQHTNISDVAIMHVSKLPSLRRLAIYQNNAVTDLGIEHLCKGKCQIEWIAIDDPAHGTLVSTNKITINGIRVLKQRFPGIQVFLL